MRSLVAHQRVAQDDKGRSSVTWLRAVIQRCIASRNGNKTCGGKTSPEPIHQSRPQNRSGWNQNKLMPISPDPIKGQQAFHDTVVSIKKIKAPCKISLQLTFSKSKVKFTDFWLDSGSRNLMSWFCPVCKSRRGGSCMNRWADIYLRAIRPASLTIWAASTVRASLGLKGICRRINRLWSKATFKASVFRR